MALLLVRGRWGECFKMRKILTTPSKFQYVSPTSFVGI